jgi:hypothetical protein
MLVAPELGTASVDREYVASTALAEARDVPETVADVPFDSSAAAK